MSIQDLSEKEYHHLVINTLVHAFEERNPSVVVCCVSGVWHAWIPTADGAHAAMSRRTSVYLFLDEVQQRVNSERASMKDIPHGLYANPPTDAKLYASGIMNDPTIWRLAAEISILPLSQLQGDDEEPTAEFTEAAAWVYADRGGLNIVPSNFIAVAVLRILRVRNSKPDRLLDFWLPPLSDESGETHVIAEIFKTCDCETIPCAHMIDAQQEADAARARPKMMP